MLYVHVFYAYIPDCHQVWLNLLIQVRFFVCFSQQLSKTTFIECLVSLPITFIPLPIKDSQRSLSGRNNIQSLDRDIERLVEHINSSLSNITRNKRRISIQKLIILRLIMPNALSMEMSRNNTRPQRQHPDISPTQLIPQRISERLLRRFIGMVDCLACKRRYF